MDKIKNYLTIDRIKAHIAIIFLAVITIITFIPVFTYLYFVKDLQSKEAIMNKNDTGIVLLDRNNTPFFTFYNARHKQFVTLPNIPEYIQNAVIAVEDKEYYLHQGFSLKGIARSLILDIKNGNTAYGGSTLTQQLVKNVLLTSKRSILRKYQEIILASEIERRYNKKEIMEMYLNSVYFGEGAFGVQQAAKIYFGKNASDLNLAESAMLAAILPAPSAYSPLSGNIEKAKERQSFVLSEMEKSGYINSKQKENALAAKLVFNRGENDFNSKAMHFALMVRDQLVQKYGEETISRSGFRVKTTIDLNWQEYAQSVLEKQIKSLSSSNVTNGSVVVIDPANGEVRVLIGSSNWFDEKYGKVNIADTPRSPGSSFKPIIYAAAFEKRLITPATPLNDFPTTFQGNYKPNDYDRKWRGIVLARRALANSLNVPSVAVMQKVGITDGLEMASRLGITTLRDPSQYGLSLVLGTGEVKLTELTNAYAVFANAGKRNNVTLITAITDKQGRQIYNYKPHAEQVIEPAVAFLISSILADVKTRSEVFGNVLNTSVHAAVKTGTGEDYKNALTIGYTPDLVVGVWLGNNNNSAMGTVAGSIGPAPVWRAIIDKLSVNSPPEPYNQPPNIITADICNYSGLLASKSISSNIYSEYFIAGTQPTHWCFIPRPTDMKDELFRSDNNSPFKNKKNNKQDISDTTTYQQELQRQIIQQVQKQLDQMHVQPTYQ